MSSLDWKEIEINWRGKRAKGRYIVSGDLVTVAAWNGTKAARRGILPAERLAQMLLRELAAETEKNKTRIPRCIRPDPLPTSETRQ
jgi:hypothetical protein